MRSAFRVALLVALNPTPAPAATPAEMQLITRSVLPSELAGVQSSTGGLDKLPLLEAEIRFDFARHTVSGTASLDWRNDTGQSVTSVPIRFASNSVGHKPPHAGWTHITVTMPGGKPVEATVRRKSPTISMVRLPASLAPGERVIFRGDLEGKLANVEQGGTDPVMASMNALMGGKAGQESQPADGEQYGTFACGDDICTLTGFTPEVPAFLDGHFDTAEGSGIGDATYSVPENAIFSVIVEPGITIAATGTQLGRVAEGGEVRWSYAMAATREVGVIASPNLAVDETVVDGVQVRSYSRPQDEDAGKHALDSAASALRLLDDAFGQYPWSFLNVAESGLVGGAGGVELPGLALGASGFYAPGGGMLALIGANADLQGEMLDFITRHEVAHQWWALQVGSHSQLHPYIDEPLAQWSALYTVRRSAGEEAAQHVKELQIAANFQALGIMGISDGVVARAAGDFGSMVEYAGLVYGKAPLFYEAAAKEFGEESIIAALRDVVSHRRFQRITPADLLEALVQHSGGRGSEMRGLWKHWFEETHGAEDLGTLDVGGLAGSLGLGVGASPQDTADALQQMDDLMRQMGDHP